MLLLLLLAICLIIIGFVYRISCIPTAHSFWQTLVADNQTSVSQHRRTAAGKTDGGLRTVGLRGCFDWGVDTLKSHAGVWTEWIWRSLFDTEGKWKEPPDGTAQPGAS